MYKVLSFLLYLIFFSSFVVYSFSGGDGTALDPYEVSNCDELQNISQIANLDDYYVLTQDIDCSGISNFQPIGSCSGSCFSSGNDFTGNFNGSGHIISNLKIENLTSTDQGWGLFGFIRTNVEIYNFQIINISVNVPNAVNVGSVLGLGLGFSNSILSEINILSGNISGNERVGGLSGSTPEFVNNTFFKGIVSGNNLIGGLAGYVGYGSITNSYSIANVSGLTSVGGLVGEIYGSEIINSYSIANVSGLTSVGGLVGSEDDSFDFNNTYWNNDTNNPGFSLGSGSITGSIAIQNNYSYFLDPTREPMASWDPTIWNLTPGQLPYLQSTENPFQSSITSTSLQAQSSSSSTFPTYGILSFSFLIILLGYFFI